MARTLVITGMHRSGTSLLASALARAGVDVGRDLLPGGKGNRHGHFEDADFVHFHEGLLTRRGGSALVPPPLQEVPTAAEEASARQLIAARADRPLWGFKDPRASLFLDLWRGLLPRPFFLLLYRHPIEVCLSLVRRGLDLDVQLEPAAALTAWCLYNERLLDFHERHRDGALLVSLAAATRSLAATVEQVGRRTGLPLATEGIDALFSPDDLQLGLSDESIRWSDVAARAMKLYARLESAADLPAGGETRPVATTARERELAEANEHLLAALLARSGAPGQTVTADERRDFSELRRALARQEEEIVRLQEMAVQLEQRLATTAEAGRALETSRAMRFVRRYWRTAGAVRRRGRQAAWQLRRLRGPRTIDPARVLVGCVTENRPEMLAQTARLLRSLRWFGGSLALARMWVCAVESIDDVARAEFTALGAEVRVVPRFDRGSTCGNQLRFLEAGLGEGCDLLLLDCDTLVVRDPLPLLRAGLLQGAIADVPSVTAEAFERVFEHFGLPRPPARYRTPLLPTPTIFYCNTGVVFVPHAFAAEFVPAWADFNRRLLGCLDLLGSCAHNHQAAFSLAHAACPIPHRVADPGFNYPLHLQHLERSPALLATDAAILHYHALVDRAGYLLPAPYPLAQARIEAFNDRLREERRRAGIDFLDETGALLAAG